MRASFESVRNPSGSTDGSVWFSSTRTVPPASLTGIGSSRRPCCDAQFVEAAQRRAGEIAELGMVALGLQLGDDDQREDDLVLGEPQERGRVGEKDRGVQDVRVRSSDRGRDGPLRSG